MVFPSQSLLAELTPVRLNNPNCQALGNFQISVKWMNFRYFLETQFFYDLHVCAGESGCLLNPLFH